MRALTPHHTNLLALRSHQWKWLLDTYTGCGFDCLYCASEVSTVSAPPRSSNHLLERLAADLDELSTKGIVFVGPRADPYQPGEARARTTRGALELLLEHEMPVVLLTKSPLVLRDRDLLLELNRQGLLMVQFTLVSLDQRVVEALEATAPPPHERLRAAAMLSRDGVPIHVHVSPLVPSLHSRKGLRDLVEAITDHGGRVIYTNPLGIRGPRHASLRNAYRSFGRAVEARFIRLYGRRPGRGVAIRLPRSRYLLDEMERFRDICLARQLSFVCEFIPALTTIQSGALSEGVFRFSLPTVYQMIPFWDSADDRWVDWQTFRREFMTANGVDDPDYLRFVEDLWESGELFINTTMRSRRHAGATSYRRTGTLRLEDTPSWSAFQLPKRALRTARELAARSKEKLKGGTHRA